MSRPRGNARQDILNTAERLFAENGIDNVSLRAINAEAGYSAAALHYHFRSRESLLEALLLERQRPVLALREQLLESLRQQGQPSTISMAEALVMPFAQLILDDPDSGLTSVKFFFRTYVDKRAFGYVQQITQESVKIFDPLLAKALPGLNRNIRRTRWLMATELTFQGLASMDAIMLTPSGKVTDSNRYQYVRGLVGFIAGGLQYNP